MICKACKHQRHCRNPKCDCQHKTGKQVTEPAQGWGNTARGPF